MRSLLLSHVRATKAGALMRAGQAEQARLAGHWSALYQTHQGGQTYAGHARRGYMLAASKAAKPPL